MGNTAATLYIKLDHDESQNGRTPSVQAGTIIKGRVVVDLSILEPKKAEHYLLELQITGSEKVVIWDGRQGSRAERKFLESSIVLCDFDLYNNVFLPGWHEFPFSVPLPASMPSSMKCDYGKTVNCEISYRMKASLLCRRDQKNGTSFPSRRRILKSPSNSSSLANSSPGILSSSSSSNSASIVFQVRAQSSPAERVPYHMEPVTHPIKTFGLVNQGTISFGVTMADTHVSKGDALEIGVAARNDSKVDLEHVQLQLVQAIEFATSERRYKKRVLTVLAEKTIAEAFMKMKTNTEVWYRNTITGLEQLHDENQHQIYIALLMKTSMFSLQVPTTTLDTYMGHLIQVSHYLEVRIKTPSLVDDPRVQIPLQFLDYHGVEAKTAEVRYTSAPIMEDDEMALLQSQTASRDHETRSPSTEPGSSRHVKQVVVDKGPATDASPTQGGTAGAHDAPEVISRLTARRMHDDEAGAFPLCPPARTVVPSWKQGTAPHDEITVSLPPFERATSTAPVVEVPLSAFESGGLRIEYANIYDDSEHNDSPLISTSSSFDVPSQDEADLPSLENLLQEMLRSMNDYELIRTKLEDPEWTSIVSSISSEEFGSIIAHVHLDFDQPRVAALVATHIVAAGESFTCHHCKEALENTADWNRVAMIRRLLPFCCDFIGQSLVITETLSSWELALAADDFALAYSNS